MSSPGSFTLPVTGFPRHCVGLVACSLPRGVGLPPATAFQVGFYFCSRFVASGASSASSLPSALLPNRSSRSGMISRSSSFSVCCGVGATTVAARFMALSPFVRRQAATCRPTGDLASITAPAERPLSIVATVAATPRKLKAAKNRSRTKSLAKFNVFSVAEIGRTTFDQAPNHALQRTAPHVTACASHHLRPLPQSPAHRPRRAPRSLSLGSLAIT